MALRDDILSLKARTRAELNAAYDYYEHTRYAWQVVQESLAARPDAERVAVSSVTGTATTAADLGSKVDGYVARQVTEATFQQFVALFEDFFFDLLALWLTAYPKGLAARSVDFQTVLDSPDKAAITAYVVGRELNELKYRKPAEWFDYLDGRVKLAVPTPGDIERIAEAKASRDVLAHNRGLVTETYLRKAGRLARHVAGDRIDIPEPYHREIWELFLVIVADLADGLAAKAA